MIPVSNKDCEDVPKKIWRYTFASITRWNSMLITRRVVKRIKCWSMYYWKTSTSNENGAKGRKLGSIQIKRDIHRKEFDRLWNVASKTKKRFLHWIGSGVNKWIYYANPNRPKAAVMAGQLDPSTPKRNIHGSKVMLCSRWDEKGVVFKELLRNHLWR